MGQGPRVKGVKGVGRLGPRGSRVRPRGSQGVRGLENRVPAEHVFTTRFDNLPIASANKSAGLVARTFAEGKDALTISSLVIEVLNHFPESFTAHCS